LNKAGHFLYGSDVGIAQGKIYKMLLKMHQNNGINKLVQNKLN